MSSEKFEPIKITPQAVNIRAAREANAWVIRYTNRPEDAMLKAAYIVGYKQALRDIGKAYEITHPLGSAAVLEARAMNRQKTLRITSGPLWAILLVAKSIFPVQMAWAPWWLLLTWPVLLFIAGAVFTLVMAFAVLVFASWVEWKRWR